MVIERNLLVSVVVRRSSAGDGQEQRDFLPVLKKVIATGVLPGHDGEGRAQRRRGVRFGLRQPGVQVRDSRAVRKVDS